MEKFKKPLGLTNIGAVCVYCASSGKIPQVYVDCAQKLGTLMAHSGLELINGAGKMGLMGATADACMAAGGKVTGVIPQFMIAHGWQHNNLTSTIITETMHERKAYMLKHADACIALPGGCGTMEELLEAITWKQLGLYLNPIVILNVAGYYDSLLQFFTQAIEQKFMRSMHQQLWQVASTPEEALALVTNTPPWDAGNAKFAAV